MLFVISSIDRKDAGDLRMATREAHLAFVRAHEDVRLGGPFLDAAGKMVGSLIFLEADDIAQAQAFAAADPYTKAGLFESVTVMPWRATINTCGAEL
ncbi:MAG: YciI family protein [Alphaproteobacteria bacterium]|nr:YciI family protein [Alphaproteobacteria bacterium]